MALQSDQDWRGLDVPNAYAVIRDIQIDYISLTAGVQVSVWADQGARDSGEDPLKSLRITFDAADVPDAVAAAATLRTEMYDALTGEAITFDSGATWDWTDSTYVTGE
jgi:hypothetical protein